MKSLMSMKGRTELDDERKDYFDEHLEYTKGTGKFVWVKHPYKSRVTAGDEAGSTKGTSDGYVYIYLKGKRFAAHKLAFYAVEGEYPSLELEVDHINHIRADNRWENLRIITRKENSRNRKLPISNTTGHVGVRKTPQGNFRASYKVDAVKIELGTFLTIEEAIEAREYATKGIFHSNHGLPDEPIQLQWEDDVTDSPVVSNL